MPKLSTHFSEPCTPDERDAMTGIDDEEAETIGEKVRSCLLTKPGSVDRAAVQRPWSPCARDAPGCEGDHDEAADHDERDDDGQQAPARNEDQFVADVLVGLEADQKDEQAEGDDAGVERFRDGVGDQVGSRRRRAAGRSRHRPQTFSTSGRPRMPEGRKISTMARMRERGDVLVVDREIGRPHALDEADQQAAEHGARQRADAAEHGRREGLDAGHEAVGEVDDAVVASGTACRRRRRARRP